MSFVTANLPLATLMMASLVSLGLLTHACWQHRQDLPPVRDKFLRTPGERLRARLDRLDARAGLLLVIGSLVPVTVLLALPGCFSRPSGNPLPYVLTLAGFVLALATIGWTLYFTLKQRRTARRALIGERIVADCLSPLITAGHHIFHDVPGDSHDPIFNLHHVVIGPAGVFTIETKTPQKRRPLPNRKKHEITFDGETLDYPWGADTMGLGPALIKANWLSEWIHQVTGRRLVVNSVLTFPGWWVNSTGSHAVRVHNPRQLAGLIRQSQGSVLDPILINLIVSQLEIRCRNVEL